MRKYYYRDPDGKFRWHGMPASSVPGHTWPMTSDALAVHPKQIAEFREHARKSGVPTDFTKTGEPILTSPGHRRKYMKSRGFFDRNCYS